MNEKNPEHIQCQPETDTIKHFYEDIPPVVRKLA